MKRLFIFLLKISLLSCFGLSADENKSIVILAGRDFNDHGMHEFRAGALLLAKDLNDAKLGVTVTVIENNWPMDDKVLVEADALVIYGDGFEKHFLNGYFDVVDKWVKSGKALGLIHTACQVPRGEKSDYLLNWTGSFYENYFSKTKHWECLLTLDSNHPISRGVKAFKIYDEWLLNLRYAPSANVSTVAKALFEDKAGDKEEPLLWTSEKPGQGRSFTYTGGHYHESWKLRPLRKLILNSLLWLVGNEVPEKGVATKTLSDVEFKKNMSPDQGKNLWQEETANLAKSKRVYVSPVLTDKFPNKSVQIDFPVDGAKEIVLLVLDGGDGISNDHVVWVDPHFKMTDGSIKPLTELSWACAMTGWRDIRIDQGLDARSLRLNGKIVKGIATHSISLIRYLLPEGVESFATGAGLADSDSGGSVQFEVYLK
jgi:type 1 glutamine amidotransferase